MRVLSLCETAMGGVGIYQNYLGGLAHEGRHLHFLVPAQHSSLIDPDLDVVTFQRRRRGLVALLHMLLRFQQTRRRLAPDIYLFHSTFALLALLLLRLSGDRSPAFYFPHGWAVSNFAEGSWKQRVVRVIEGRLSGLATCVVNVSTAECELAQRLGYRGRMRVIENAVPDVAERARLPEPIQPNTLQLLFVGRFDRQKGLDLLLQAFARASRQRHDLRLNVIGEAVRGGHNPSQPPPNVQLVGWVDRAEIDHWYRSADAILVPSRWEGLPLVIPEALRNGTPVLCSRRSGMERLVTPGATGDHFPLTVEAIESLLLRLDRDELRRMRPACRAAYEARFAMTRWRAEIDALLSEDGSAKALAA